MKISKRFIFFLPFLICSAGLAYYLSESISTKYKETERVKNVDALVINKLQQIRDVQITYMEAHHEYADNWDSLITFAHTGVVHNIQRKEEVITKANGKDSILVTLDTLNTQSAFDIIQNKTNMTKSQLDQLMMVPISADTFSIYANRLQGSWVFEVKDETPSNPRRQKGGDLKGLKIGSRLQSTTKGNWE